ncbi:hypothetical protein GGTG_04498 [Gaeumannomyces tritici R3-111a-1]|uniref:Uncharacterized protein n=1 Tax=Gaeumannomyces tritici (strain R3-111a-1) TaxID=644352 RepID=J3NT99_GAET3|nr:hypothetical protein GGTG_04498 [Gaeumannomyces tritici R3-111a-1]EJT79414.1 hypothetical protein GGTG_04498 [Gaeumannomyces tritici R3-111a-1]
MAPIVACSAKFRTLFLWLDELRVPVGLPPARPSGEVAISKPPFHTEGPPCCISPVGVSSSSLLADVRSPSFNPHGQPVGFTAAHRSGQVPHPQVLGYSTYDLGCR